jgi:hypothetical protein
MNKKYILWLFLLFSTSLLLTAAAPLQQTLDPDPPDEVVKLIFIHHSTGENWLTDGYGNLGRELGENNYFVSDTNYGWGPDYIGDNTDIPAWLEWFRSPQTPTYMQALFNENGQHSNYTRTLSDPGGENQIVMFKSCFPNSELTGNPNDPPGTYEDLSVGGAKYVYNQLLQYFESRPDKLFVVITAPPLSDRAYAKNARAFNQWLVNDWLQENNYTLNNVAVFDFYNVLTSANAHHRYQSGSIEHVVANSNTLAYPSGDDHPSEKGSRKATEEFIPLLNIFYNSWKKDAPVGPPAGSSAPEAVEEELQPESGSEAPSTAPVSGGLIDDFEADNPHGTNGWEPFWDEATPTSMHCAAESEMASSGSRSLLLDFDVAPDAWATCAMFYDSPQNWSGGEGLTFNLYAAQSGTIFDVDIYAGSGDTQETYLFTIEMPAESTEGWVPISLNWSDFHRADWEADAGQPFAKPDQVTGVAFGMNTYPDTPNTGRLWVDDLSLLGQGSTSPAAPDQAEADAPAEEAQDAETTGGLQLPCGIGFILPVFLISAGTYNRKRLL